MINSNFIAVAGLLYMLAMIFYTSSIFFDKKALARLGIIICLIGLLTHITGFIMRTVEFYSMSHGDRFVLAFPITNLYESLQFFALLLIIANIVIEIKFSNKLIGAFLTGLAGATLLFTSAIGASVKVEPLVPALQSNWLLAHVSMSFIAYVFFALSAICAYMYLICSSKSKKSFSYIFWTSLSGIASATLFYIIADVIFNDDGSLAAKVMYLIFAVLLAIIFWLYGLTIKRTVAPFCPELVVLNELTYKFAVVGFIIFTIGGLIFGAIWAEVAWGRYWSWDPKETWALITWGLYAVYLHGRLLSKWNAVTSNVLAVIGFLLTIFTFLGVNLLLSGLHSYGGM